jgi:succinylarginine dihydrolase
MHFVKVTTEQVSIDNAVRSYLFNTQIITLPSGEMAIIAPTNCQENPAVFAYLNELVTLGTPIKQVRYYDVKQSMQNGGGPACLRLRVAMNEQEVAAVNQNTLMNDGLFTRLNTWVDRHYRDQLTVSDLADPQLIIESRTALDELTQILKLGSVYQFQR